jgi:hypothetical protein
MMAVILLLFFVRFIITKGKFPKGKTLIEQIIRKVCWNMVIKTFQGGFLIYSLSALMTLSNSKKPSDLAISSLILTGLVTMVIINCIYLWKKPAQQLARKYVRSRLGATYSELNIYSRSALLQSTLFYVYRLVASLLLIGLVPFALQLHGLVVITLAELCFM